jgi:hypothetical protein
MLELWYPFINLHNHIYMHSKVVIQINCYMMHGTYTTKMYSLLSQCKVRRKTVTVLAIMQKKKKKN